MKAILIVLLLVVTGCSFESEKRSMEPKSKFKILPVSDSPIVLAKKDLLARSAETVQLKKEIQALKEQIGKIVPETIVCTANTKKEKRNCPKMIK